MTDFSIRSRRVLLPGMGAPRPATLVIRAGKVDQIAHYDSGDAVIDVGHSVIMPGIVDTHAHINEPGRTEWEGFETATRAAAAGGITTVIDMPLNSIPATTTVAALAIKAQAARKHCNIDYGFWGGVVPGNTHELAPMVEAGALGFKAFLTESGVDEFPMSREADLREAMPILARLGVPLLAHAELSGPASSAPAPSGDPRRYQTYLESRPASWEIEAIRLLIRLARETRCRTHVVHLSAADAIADLRSAQAAGVPITAETCPHYLAFAAEEIPDGATGFKCAPPIRERANQDRLWQGLRDHAIEFVVSDHSPCTPALKALESGDFVHAWGGISGLQFSLPVVWTEMRRRDLSLADLSAWMSAKPARFAGLAARKGAIAPGLDADFVVWDPEQEFTLETSQIRHRHKLTPYSGRRLTGAVQQTYVRGTLVHDSTRHTMLPPAGEQLKGRP